MKNAYLNKALATAASAALCSFSLYLTDGETGLGWFIISLIFIW